jgi:hypothetical protein
MARGASPLYRDYPADPVASGVDSVGTKLGSWILLDLLFMASWALTIPYMKKRYINPNTAIASSVNILLAPFPQL